MVGKKKVRCKLCVPPATTTLCVCVCTPIIRYSMVKEATIQIAKITIRFSTTERKDTLSQLQ